jgi:uncharacterized membrane protein
MGLFWASAATFAASLIPGLELRVGIPTGLAMGLPTLTAVAVAVIGNTLQVPIALHLVDWAYRNAGRFPRVQAWLQKTERQLARHQALIRRWGWIGLAAFVLLPLPATGVFGGVVLSRLLRIPALGIWSGIGLGIALSGAIFGLGAHGLLSLLGS